MNETDSLGAAKASDNELMHGGPWIAMVDALGRLHPDDDLRLWWQAHLAITTFCCLPPDDCPPSWSQAMRQRQIEAARNISRASFWNSSAHFCIEATARCARQRGQGVSGKIGRRDNKRPACRDPSGT